MIKATLILAGLSIALIAAAPATMPSMDAPTTAPSASADKPVNTKCPVSGDDIDAAVTTTQDGKTVAFCCKDCIKKFKADPEKYMKDLK